VTAPAWLGLGPAAWVAYAWGSQLAAWAGAAVWRGRGGQRQIALTFDDGPDPAWTPRVLDVLARHAVRGAFFLVGQRAAAAPGLARRIAEEGHDIGNHTWAHRALWCLGPVATWREVGDGHRGVAEACGRPPRFFRPPWGMTNLALFPALNRLGTPCVFWSLQPEGRRAAPPATQVARVMAGARPGAIVDLHDADGVPGAGARAVAALPELIARLRDAGYTLVALRDFLCHSPPPASAPGANAEEDTRTARHLAGSG
jgi:peptidoglycan/xylan/chitin deacetylase (PgdA/CDA1 family)